MTLREFKRRLDDKEIVEVNGSVLYRETREMLSKDIEDELRRADKYLAVVALINEE